MMCRIALGRGTTTRGAIFALALLFADQVMQRGMRVLSIRASHFAPSASRYVHFADGGGRRWLVRVSDHPLPSQNDHPVPHLDFVSRDGTSGLAEAVCWLDKVMLGEIQWFDPNSREAMRERRRARA